MQQGGIEIKISGYILLDNTIRCGIIVIGAIVARVTIAPHFLRIALCGRSGGGPVYGKGSGSGHFVTVAIDTLRHEDIILKVGIFLANWR